MNKHKLTFEQRKAAFIDLGHTLGDLVNKQSLKSSKNTTDFQDILEKAKAENQWFTEDNMLFAFKQWQMALDKENLENWLNPYDIKEEQPALKIGIIMAGNIPLVGFHDFLSTLMLGHHAVMKLSSNDKRLLPYLAKALIKIEPAFKSKITFIKDTLKNFDAVIATGSNNTARYFEYYFRNKPHIIRKNRNAVAVLTGNETLEDIQKLGEDIFRFFGLGCRNVSKLFIPQNFDFDLFFKGISNFKPYIYHHKYANNYDYNKAVYLMSDIKFLDNDFIVIKEDQAIASPIGVLNYEIYENETNLADTLKSYQDHIQCITGQHELCEFNFGEAQKPGLSDYADGVDTIKFLQNLHTKISL